MDKPNIPLIQADQLAPQFLSAYGYPLIEAPAISRLAEEGVLFEKVYSNSPLWAPSSPPQTICHKARSQRCGNDTDQ